MRALPDLAATRPRYREYAPSPDLAQQVRCFWRITGKLALIETALRARRAGLYRRAAPRWLRAAVRLLEGGDSGPGLQRVRDEVGASERTHERQFREMVGISPKTFHRVARFRRALERMQRRSRAPYAAVAADAGYADQAHLIREFKSLAGITPAAYAREWDAVGFVQYRPPTHA
ncbi:MAG: helix-turn-helix domain-containing protein [Gemmatimonadales bacterium]